MAIDSTLNPKPTKDNDLYKVVIDYPPAYNEYGKQLLERDLDNAIRVIFRSFYGSSTLIPEVPGMFLDIVRYTHVLDDPITRSNINTKVNAVIADIVPETSPSVEIDYNPIDHRMTYHISIRGETILRVDSAGDPDKATITWSDKKFYE